MKRKAVALALVAGLCMFTTMSAFASSSTTDSNSSRIRMLGLDEEEETEEDTGREENNEATRTVEQAVDESDPGEAIDYETVHVAVAAEDGKVMINTLEEVVEKSKVTMKQSIDSIIQISLNQTEGVITQGEAERQIVDNLCHLLTTPPSRVFMKTMTALALMKGADMEVNHCGTVRTAAAAKDAYGNTIASAGMIKNVTTSAYLILIGFHEDGTIEYVEGFVDPITGMVLGIFENPPGIITVLVLA